MRTSLHLSPVPIAWVACVMALVPQATPAQNGRASGTLDSAQFAQRRANAIKILSPARFALEKRTELALDAGQIATLQRLAVAMDDSGSVRRSRAAAAEHVSNPATSAIARGAASWTDALDETGIRAEYCQQSEAQADAMIGLIRDRHMVGIVLTSTQRTKLEEIFAASVNSPPRK